MATLKVDYNSGTLNNCFNEMFFILITTNRCLEMKLSHIIWTAQRIVGEQKMVYCTKCGTKNEDDAMTCVNCKEPLGNYQTVRRERRRKESECFGLPNGGSIAGLVIGLIIILWGVTSVLDISIRRFPMASDNSNLWDSDGRWSTILH